MPHRSLVLVAFVALPAFPVQAQCEVTDLVAGDPHATDWFGQQLATDGVRIAVSSRDAAPSQPKDGAVYLFGPQKGAWEERAKLVASDSNGEQFGYALDLRGDLLVVSDPEHGSGFASLAGAVYVYREGPVGWTEVQRLEPGLEGGQHRFGASVATDGEHLIVGADLAPNDQEIGVAFLYRAAGHGFVPEKLVLASDFAPGDRFGWSVALEGEWAFVSAPWDGDFGESTGAVYVLRDVDGAWTEVQKLLPSDAALGHGFGMDMALSGDLLAVAATGQPNAIYVYRRHGDTWTEEAKITGGLAGASWSGSPLDLDGETLVCTGLLGNVGVVATFERDGGAWTFRGTTTSSDHLPDDTFGASVVLAGDVLAVGARTKTVDDVQAAGKAYVFDPQVVPACLVGDRTEAPASNVLLRMTFTTAAAYADATYLVVGSLSGAGPGVDLGPVHVPLNLDAYATFSASHANQAPLFDTLGAIDPTGHAVGIQLGPWSTTTLVGIEAHHACLVLQDGAVVAVSQALPFLITP